MNSKDQSYLTGIIPIYEEVVSAIKTQFTKAQGHRDCLLLDESRKLRCFDLYRLLSNCGKSTQQVKTQLLDFYYRCCHNQVKALGVGELNCRHNRLMYHHTGVCDESCCNDPNSQRMGCDSKVLDDREFPRDPKFHL